jgi:hypothetical protein
MFNCQRLRENNFENHVIQENQNTGMKKIRKLFSKNDKVSFYINTFVFPR